MKGVYQRCCGIDVHKATVVRKNSTTVMQRGPRERTRGEARLKRSAPPLGLIGRSHASGVASGRENSGVNQEGLAPKKSAVGLDCNVGPTTAEFFEDVPINRSRG